MHICKPGLRLAKMIMGQTSKTAFGYFRTWLGLLFCELSSFPETDILLVEIDPLLIDGVPVVAAVDGSSTSKLKVSSPWLSNLKKKYQKHGADLKLKYTLFISINKKIYW